MHRATATAVCHGIQVLEHLPNPQYLRYLMLYIRGRRHWVLTAPPTWQTAFALEVPCLQECGITLPCLKQLLHKHRSSKQAKTCADIGVLRNC